jgi:hypothetical protein
LPTILGFGLVDHVRAGYPVGWARHHHEERLRWVCRVPSFIFFVCLEFQLSDFSKTVKDYFESRIASTDVNRGQPAAADAN